jgi:Protein of unknown function (DUF5656)
MSSSVSIAAIPQPGRIPLLAAMYALGLVLFLAIEPTRLWLLVLVAGMVALGTDGIVRTHPKSVFRDAIDTAPHLIVPTIVGLAAGLFLEDTVVGYWTLLASLVAGVIMAGVVYAEYLSVDAAGSSYGGARFALNVFTYLGAFALFAAFYSFETALLPAALCVGLVSAVLGSEIMRDPHVMHLPVAQASLRVLGFVVVIGLIVAEARWALYFTPLDGFLAAVFLLLTFYVASGLVQHYLLGHLTTSVITEFATVAALGVTMIILGHAFAEA